MCHGLTGVTFWKKMQKSILEIKKEINKTEGHAEDIPTKKILEQPKLKRGQEITLNIKTKRD